MNLRWWFIINNWSFTISCWLFGWKSNFCRYLSGWVRSLFWSLIFLLFNIPLQLRWWRSSCTWSITSNIWRSCCLFLWL